MRPWRLVGSIASLLMGLFWIERIWEIWDMKGSYFAFGGSVLTAYGLGVVAEISVALSLGVAFLWLFYRLGSSKPLPRFPRLHRGFETA